MSAPTPLIVIGQQHEQMICEDLRRTQIVRYAGVSGDYSPLHTDEAYAVAVGYPGVMAHGMMIMSATSSVLTDWVGVEGLTRLSARFRAPAWPGDGLTAVVTVETVRDEADGVHVEFRLSTTNQDGVEVLAGTATARLDHERVGAR